MHGCCGFWGCIATGLFSVPAYAWGAGGGLFYGEGKQLGIILLVALAQIAWVSVTPAPTKTRHLGLMPNPDQIPNPDPVPDA